MKKWFLLFAFCLCHLTVAAPIQDRKIDRDGLLQLMRVLNIPEGADIVAETQKRWLRKPGQERWEMAELSSEQREFVLNWAKGQGLYDSWKPSYEVYDKAFILGATTSRMQSRLDYLRQLWEEGTRFREIVWLTGDRPLDQRVDGLTDRCSNESDAARIIWEEAVLPEAMRKLSIVFVAVPMKKEGAILKRPNTEDTIFAWLDTSPAACTTLFVSDQPFCGYQFAVIKSVLPKQILFDVVGRGVDGTSHPSAAAITLDSLARWIYQENLSVP